MKEKEFIHIYFKSISVVCRLSASMNSGKEIQAGSCRKKLKSLFGQRTLKAEDKL